MTAKAANEVIREQVEEIVSSGALGRSRFYAALLKYLADCSMRGHVPKEVEIAVDVFDKHDGFDPSQDSMVRVYAHKLRQKLQDYYAKRDVDEADQVAIPKGEYRVTLGADAPDAAEVVVRLLPSGAYRLAGIVAISVVAGLLLGRISTDPNSEPNASMQAVAESALWAPVTADDLPVTIVVGDYYIFGELDPIGNVDRLVREFAINSVRDLDDWFMLEPENSDRYIDLDLTYLPTSIAFAMRDLMSVMDAAGKETRVVSMSNFDISVIRDSHVIYLGFLSGLGMLRDFVFAGSELAIGETPDELVHRPTGVSFISEAGMPSGEQSYLDYGLFSALAAPGGNRFVFIAGTRDEGLMQTARAVADSGFVQTSIDAITADGHVPSAYELLYEVSGLGRTNLDATIVHAAARDDSRITVGQLGPQ